MRKSTLVLAFATLLLSMLFISGCKEIPRNVGLKPGDFGYVVYEGDHRKFTYLNDSIVIYHRSLEEPIINLHTGEVIEYADPPLKTVRKVKGDDNTITIN